MACCFVKRMVALGGNVEYWLSAEPAHAFLLKLREMMCECGKQRGVISFRAARSERAIRGRGVVTEARAEGANQMLLDFDGKGIVFPDGELWIECCH